MRRWRRIAEFGEAEFLGASFHDAPRRLEGRALEVFPHAPAPPRAWDLPLDRGGIML